MNKFEKFLEKKGISKSDFSEMSETETQKLELEFYKETLKNAPTKEDIDAVKTSLNQMAKTEDVTKLQNSIDEAIEKLAKMEEETTPNNESTSLRQSIKNALKENVEVIKSMKDNPNAKATITVKAVQSMTFGTNTTGNVGRTEREAGIYSASRRTPILLDIVNTSSTEAKTIEWVEKTGHEGGVSMVAEGTVKPQGDWDLALFSQQAKKDAIIVTVSKEMLDDVDGMAKDIEDEIYEQIRLFTESQVLNGDGTGNNIVGLDANATPYVAGAFLNQIEKANEFDAIRTAINQVELNNDFPNYVLMHPSDATLMELQKDATTSQYVMPPFASVSGATIKGLPIKTSTLVAQGTAYVGNFNRFKVKIREDITFQMGYRGNAGDWEKNMVSFLGEQRFFGFIPAVHYGSIVKLDFTVAKALLDPNVADS